MTLWEFRDATFPVGDNIAAKSDESQHVQEGNDAVSALQPPFFPKVVQPQREQRTEHYPDGVFSYGFI